MRRDGGQHEASKGNFGVDTLSRLRHRFNRVQFYGSRSGCSRQPEISTISLRTVTLRTDRSCFIAPLLFAFIVNECRRMKKGPPIAWTLWLFGGCHRVLPSASQSPLKELGGCGRQAATSSSYSIHHGTRGRCNELAAMRRVIGGICSLSSGLHRRAWCKSGCVLLCCDK